VYKIEASLHTQFPSPFPFPEDGQEDKAESSKLLIIFLVTTPKLGTYQESLVKQEMFVSWRKFRRIKSSLPVTGVKDQKPEEKMYLVHQSSVPGTGDED
jgi:hypothetical protein